MTMRINAKLMPRSKLVTLIALVGTLATICQGASSSSSEAVGYATGVETKNIPVVKFDERKNTVRSFPIAPGNSLRPCPQRRKRKRSATPFVRRVRPRTSPSVQPEKKPVPPVSKSDTKESDKSVPGSPAKHESPGADVAQSPEPEPANPSQSDSKKEPLLPQVGSAPSGSPPRLSNRPPSHAAEAPKCAPEHTPGTNFSITEMSRYAAIQQPQARSCWANYLCCWDRPKRTRTSVTYDRKSKKLARDILVAARQIWTDNPDLTAAQLWETLQEDKKKKLIMHFVELSHHPNISDIEVVKFLEQLRKDEINEDRLENLIMKNDTNSFKGSGCWQKLKDHLEKCLEKCAIKCDIGALATHMIMAFAIYSTMNPAVIANDTVRNGLLIAGLALERLQMGGGAQAHNLNLGRMLPAGQPTAAPATTRRLLSRLNHRY